jgi:hypothetical protein
MLDEPFMLFSGPCSAAEQGAGMLSPCSAESPKPPSSTTNASGSNSGNAGPAAGAGNVIHVHPHTVAGSRLGGSHFNAPSPPRPPKGKGSGHGQPQQQQQQDSLGRSKGKKVGLSIADAVREAEAENCQLTQRSDASGDLEACLDLPQRPATARARGGAFNSFFFKLGGSSTNVTASTSGSSTPASGSCGSSGKKKKRAFPGFTPKGLGGMGFGSLSTPRHAQASSQQGEKPSLGKNASSAASQPQGSGSSPPASGSLTRASSLLNL